MNENHKPSAENSKSTMAKKLKYDRDKKRQKVKGKFKYHEVPGGQMSFVYREFKEDPIEKYTLKDEGIYEIPLGVAKHLNKNAWYPVHMNQVDQDGNPTQIIGTKVRRCSFTSLEFTDIEDEE